MLHHIWRLSEAGADNLGLACNEEGLFLGRTPLLERRDGCFDVREADDIRRLLGRAYQMEVEASPFLGGLATVAAALNGNDLLLARIAAVHLRIPDLPDAAARERLETQDRLIKSANADWDPALHPRGGTPPNPGWFAPTDGSSSESSQATEPVVSNDRDVASADESMRPGQKPDMPAGGGGGGFSTGRPVPVEQSGVRPLEDILAPNGKPVGVVNPGATTDIRTVSPAEFEALRSNLLTDAVPVAGPKGYPGEVFERPDGSLIGIRRSLESGMTIDVIKSTSPAIENGLRIHQQ
jgi:hypothetical protein